MPGNNFGDYGEFWLVCSLSWVFVQKGYFVYCHWAYTSIYRPLSYPYRSMGKKLDCCTFIALSSLLLSISFSVRKSSMFITKKSSSLNSCRFFKSYLVIIKCVSFDFLLKWRKSFQDCRQFRLKTWNSFISQLVQPVGGEVIG